MGSRFRPIGRGWVAALMAIVIGVGCTSPPTSGPPPTATLNTSVQALTDVLLNTAAGGQVGGWIIAVCEPGGCVMEQEAPVYRADEFLALPENPRVFLIFGGPVPDSVELELLADDDGDGLYLTLSGNRLTAQPTGTTVSWHFQNVAGRYVLNLVSLWDEGYQAVVQWPVMIR